MLTNEDITTSNIGNLSDSNEVQINSNVENDSEFIGHDDNNIGDMVNVELDDTDFDFFDELNAIGSVPISLTRWEMTGLKPILNKSKNMF